MTLYEINAAILSLIDDETGEVLDYERFLELNMAREEKIENIGLWIKDLKAEASALKEEKEALAKRQRSAENKAERLTNYLAMMLDGAKFKTPRLSVSYRTSKAVEVDDNFLAWAKENRHDLLSYKEPEVSKTAIKEALSNGEEIPYAEIVEKRSVQIG